ncbi:MAG: hypothetical protein AB203_00340 [Parcubacteria bacterium C7867-008]|nr:MAG: hypothetical protein AB203_00340 [Parcubacteria bacterium C7867-008]
MRPTRNTTKYLKSLQTLKLDESVKARMRDGLDAYADLHVVTAPISVPVQSPFFAYSFMRTSYSVFAMALVLLVTGSGAAYASEGSLPGSPLYKVKVAVIEPVRGALITSTEGQAQWHANLAARRLEEATKLAVSNKLDASSSAYLQDQFETEVRISTQAADTLTVTGNTEAALDARSDLEARITAHAQILGLVSEHLKATVGEDASGFLDTRAFLAVINQHRDEVVQARLALEDSAEDDDSTTAVTLARADVTAKTVVSLSRTQAPDDVEDVAEPHLDTARAALMRAQETTDETEASNKSHEAERASEVATILLQHAKFISTLTVATTTATTTPTIDPTDDRVEKEPLLEEEHITP